MKVHAPLVEAARPVPVQRSAVRVVAANDPLEIEADELADRVMRMPAPAVGSAGLLGAEQCPNGCRNGEAVGREPVDDEELIHAKPLSAESWDGHLDEGAADAIRRRRGGGAPLPSASRRFFEPRFGVDLSLVRVHHDAAAADLAARVNARAFAVGRDVFFGSGQWAPGTAWGDRLIAHELGHTVGQSSRKASGPPLVGRQPSTDQGPRASQADLMQQELSAFEHTMLATFEGWTLAARTVGSAYATAGLNFQHVVEGRGEEAEAAWKIASAALAIGTIGVASWLSSGLQGAVEAEAALAESAKMGEIASSLTNLSLAVNVIEDTFQAGFGDGLQEVAPSVSKLREDGGSPISGNPQKYQNDMENAISRFKQRFHQAMSDTHLVLADHIGRGLHPGLADFFDPDAMRARHVAFFEQAHGFASIEDLKDEATIARDFERTMWAQWLPGGLKWREYMNPGHIDLNLRPWFGWALAERFDELLVTKESGVGDWGLIAQDAEITAVVEWFERYKPPSVLKE